MNIPNVADAGFADQAKPDSKDFDILTASLGRSAVLSGCAVTAQGSPDMTVAVASGTVYINGKGVAVAAGNVTITTANATNPRFDLICVAATGVKSAVAGTAAATPAFPAVPANSVCLAAVYVPANDTAIDANQIIDKRVILKLSAPNVFDITDYGAVPDDYYEDGVALNGQGTVTATAATNLLTKTTHGFVANDVLSFTTTGTLPAPLALATKYFVIASGLTANDFKVSTTLGGTEVDITDTGTGTHTVRPAFTSATANFTAADVGRVIRVQRAGAANVLVRTTTVATFIDSTTVVPTNQMGVTNSPVRFLISRGGDSTAAIHAAMDACKAVGGGTVLAPGAGYLTTGITLRDRVRFRGAGRRATTIHLAPSSTKPTIANDFTFNANSLTNEVYEMCVDGAGDRQVAPTTTLALAYTAGGTSLFLNDATLFLPSGHLKIGSVWFRYQSKSGSLGAGAGTFTATAATNLLTKTAHGLVADNIVIFTTTTTLPAPLAINTPYYVISSGLDANNFKVSTTLGGAEVDITTTGTGTHTVTPIFEIKGALKGGVQNTTDANQAQAATVTQYVQSCIYLATNPFNTQQPVPVDDFDSHHHMHHLIVMNTIGSGIEQWGLSEGHWDHIYGSHCDQPSFVPSFDTMISHCDSGHCGRMGFYVWSTNVMMTVCKSFFSGNVTAADGIGFLLESAAQPAPGHQLISSCVAQDNKANGWLLKNSDRVILAACGADSNSTSGVGSYAGIKLVSANANKIDIMCSERIVDGTNSYQQNALEIDTLSTDNKILVTHGAVSTATVGAAIKSTSDLGALATNDIQIMLTTTGGATGRTGFWTTVSKAADEARQNTTTLTNDGALFFTMLASTNYRIRGKVFFDATAAGDFKYFFSAPASPTLVRMMRIHNIPGAALPVFNAIDVANPAAVALAGTGTTGGYVDFDIIWQNGVNAGVFAFQWAQNTLDNNAGLKVLAGSYLEYGKA